MYIFSILWWNQGGGDRLPCPHKILWQASLPSIYANKFSIGFKLWLCPGQNILLEPHICNTLTKKRLFNARNKLFFLRIRKNSASFTDLPLLISCLTTVLKEAPQTITISKQTNKSKFLTPISLATWIKSITLRVFQICYFLQAFTCMIFYI